MLSTRLVAAAAAAAVIFVAVVLWVSPSQTDFAPSNWYWDGLRSAVREFNLTPLISLGDLPLTPSETALVLIPSLPPSRADLEALKAYVENGGVLILLNDFGAGNAVLTGLEVGARFDDRLLVDPLFSHRSRRLPRIVDLLRGPLAEGVETLVLNHATVISEDPGLRIVARSSLASFLDANRNGQRDPGEPQGPFVVAGLARVGAGRAVLISDPSIMLNGMLDLGDNRRFVRNVLSLAGTNGKVFVDQSLLPRAPMDVAKLALLRGRAALAHPSVSFVLIVAVLAIPLMLLAKPQEEKR